MPPDCLSAQDPCDKSNFYVNQVLSRLQEGSHRLLQLQNKVMFYLATRGSCWLILEVRWVPSQDLKDALMVDTLNK